LLVASICQRFNVFVAKKDFQQGIQLYQEALTIADEENLIDRKRLLNFHLYDCYEKIGFFKSALEYHKSFKTLNDTIYNSNQDQIVFDINTKYETEKKEKELVIQKAENLENTQRLKLMGSTSFLLSLLLASGVYAYRKLRNQKKIITFKEKEKGLLEFIEKTKPDFPIIWMDNDDFFKYSGGRLPAIVYIEDGVIKKKWFGDLFDVEDIRKYLKN